LTSGEGDLLRFGGGDLDLDLDFEPFRSGAFASLLALGLRLERFFGGDFDADFDREPLFDLLLGI